MAIYYLTSLADQELIETEEFKTKKALYENSESDIIISEIENYLSKFDGQLKVEISEESFDEAECDNIDEMNNRPWN